MAKAKIHLHNVLKEIEKVKRQLQAAKKGASAEDTKELNRLIKGLGSVRANTTMLCPKVQGVWPAYPTTAKKKKPSSK
jgi:hypothetical protein